MTGGALPESCFVVLALLAEGEAHGYEIQRRVHDRGFRFWTKLQRTSIYKALGLLEAEGLVTVDVRPSAGPARKVYRITGPGLSRLRAEGRRRLAAPAHPRSEIDLGVYALPFLSPEEARAAFADGLDHLKARKAFIEERFSWCRAEGLYLPALAFERPLLALEAEIAWLERVADEFERSGASAEEWARYVYREPPAFESDEPD